MLRYYASMTIRALKRDRWVTALVVFATGLGVAGSMTNISVIAAMSADPLPGRSQQLYYPHIDASPPGFARQAALDATADLTWTDAENLLRAHRAKRQAMMASGRATVRTATDGHPALRIRGRYVTSEFFGMFQAPFHRGAAWTSIADNRRERVVVLSKLLAKRLFAGEPAVGKLIRLDETEFRVSGVLSEWRPQPLFFEASGGAMFGSSDDFFIPLPTAIDRQMGIGGNMTCWGEGKRTGDQCTWLQFWVQLPKRSRADYERFLEAYASEQRENGRNIRLVGAPLLTLPERLAQLHYIPGDLRLRLSLALAFLVICILNSTGLLLAKFFEEGFEIALRRALGATRRQILLQYSFEAVVTGFLGGGVALATTCGALWWIRHGVSKHAALAQVDAGVVATTIAMSILSVVVAAAFPAWRACKIEPAHGLKEA
jgi:putative ABC transport system permease protein